MLDRDSEELYATILGIRPPWHVTQVEVPAILLLADGDSYAG